VGLLDALLRPNSRLTKNEVAASSERTTEIGAGLSLTHDAAKERNVLALDLSAAQVVAAMALGSSALDLNGQSITNLASLALVKGFELRTAELTTINNTATPIPGFSYALASGHALTMLMITQGVSSGPLVHADCNLRRLVNDGSLTTKSNDSLGTPVDDIGIGGLTPVLTTGVLTCNFTGRSAKVITTRFAWIVFSL
jgi:hypothetical protein